MTWQRVRIMVRCLFGDEIGHGEWALVGRTGAVGVCVEHAKQHYRNQIPAGLWSEARAKAKREGVSMRALLLTLLERWVKEG